MTWVKVDDSFADHPKVMALGRDRIIGVGLWASAACYCARHLTDGFVPSAAAAGFGHPKVWDRLVTVGLIDVVAGGYQLHDWLEYNPPRSKVLRDRQAAKDRMQRNRSPEVQPNEARTNGEVRPKFGDPVPVPVPGPVPVSEVLLDVPGNGSAREPFVEPTELYATRARRKSLSQKERDWIEDLHARFSRPEVVRALLAVNPGPDYLKRVDAYLEAAA